MSSFGVAMLRKYRFNLQSLRLSSFQSGLGQSHLCIYGAVKCNLNESQREMDNYDILGKNHSHGVAQLKFRNVEDLHYENVPHARKHARNVYVCTYVRVYLI